MNVLKVNGITYSTWSECASMLMECFFPAARMENEGLEEGMNVEESVRIFEWSEVNDAVRKAKLNKAHGLDGINAEMMRMIWNAIPGWLLRMYNECLRYGCFSNEWKKACFMVLPKSPDKPRTDPALYRPISLLSMLGKTLERMVVARMEAGVNVSMNEA